MITIGDTTQWVKDKAEDLRYQYDLNENSIVVDVGASVGNFTKRISEMYNRPFILAYEPTDLFSLKEGEDFKGYYIPVAASIYDGKLDMGEYDGEASEFHQDNRFEVECVDFYPHVTSLLRPGEKIDLLKLNIEAGEYILLEGMMNAGCDMTVFRSIQVQFHLGIADCDLRYQRIVDWLSETHETTWDYPFVWRNFELKECYRS